MAISETKMVIGSIRYDVQVSLFKWITRHTIGPVLSRSAHKSLFFSAYSVPVFRCFCQSFWIDMSWC